VGPAGAPVPVKDEPGEQVHEEDVEAEVAVEVSADPLPFEPQEAGDHGVLQQVTMLLNQPEENQFCIIFRFSL